MKVEVDSIAVNGRHRRDLGDIESLAQSIEQVGLLHPIVITKDRQLIAGERRLAAMKLRDIKHIEATVAETLGDAVLLLTAERDENTCRKDFAPSEAVAVGEALEEMERAGAKQRQREHGGTAPGRNKNTGGKLPPVKAKTRDKVAKAVGFSGRTYEKAKAVVKAAEAEPEKFGPLAKTMDQTGNVDKAFRKLNAHRIADAPARKLPAGQFDLILADPPWAYEHSKTDSRHLDNQYPTLSVEDICAINPPAADDSVLFLWATTPQLPEALKVMAAWGFTYKSSAVWDKEKIGMGYWFRGQHELLLVGTRGRFSPPDETRRVASVFREKRQGHTTKPDCVRKALEKMFPKVTRLEMFARGKFDGWTTWGNQA